MVVLAREILLFAFSLLFKIRVLVFFIDFRTAAERCKDDKWKRVGLRCTLEKEENKRRKDRSMFISINFKLSCYTHQLYFSIFAISTLHRQLQ